MTAPGHLRSGLLTEDVELLELHGELDTTIAGEIKETILATLAAGRARVVVDATQATFLDSATIGALVGGATRLAPAGGRLVLVCTDEAILDSLRIAALDQVMAIHGSRRAALHDLRAGITQAEAVAGAPDPRGAGGG